MKSRVLVFDTIVNKIFVAMLASLVFGVANQAIAACDEPAKPGALPDAETAVSAQMIKAKNEVTAYVKGMEAYLACASISRRDEKAKISELEDYAENFNKIIRAYKARKK